MTEPAGPAADVGDVGDAALEQLVVGGRQRHPPGALALGRGGGEEGVGQRVVVGEDPGHLVAERDDDRAGQRGEIDHAARLEALLRVPEHVGQHEPALGVGVDHLDGVALHRAHHVARALRLAVGHVLDQARPAPTTLAGALRSARVFITPATTPAPPMSMVISSMPAPGLIEMPPVSKTTPLPTSAKGASSPPPFHCMTTTLDGLSEPCADRQQRAHAERLELGLVQHLDLDAELLAAPSSRLGELGGGRARWPAR